MVAHFSGGDLFVRIHPLEDAGVMLATLLRDGWTLGESSSNGNVFQARLTRPQNRTRAEWARHILRLVDETPGPEHDAAMAKERLCR
mgnify:FL=1